MSVRSTHTETDEDLYRLAELNTRTMNHVTAQAVGEPVHVQTVRHSAFPYQWGSVSTAGLWKVVVSYATPSQRNGDHAFFVKLLRNPRLWPQLNLLPEAIRREFLDYLPWKFEYEVHESGIAEALPPGMRMPILYHAEHTGDDWLALWWECVDLDPEPWRADDFARTAYLLGRLAAKRRPGAAVNARLPAICHQRRFGGALRYFVTTRVQQAELPILRERSTWQTPLLAQALAVVDDPELPEDLARLADRLPAILDQLDRLPHTFAHGDASPQNLLIPRTDRDERVVIDWGFGTLLPIGFDLGQLLVGLVHAGEMAPTELENIQSVIVPAYVEGLAEDRYWCAERDVRQGFLGSLVARSALTSIPTELLDQPVTDDNQELLVDRLLLTRYLVELAKDLG
ncbi:phosphotransferase [Hoyosella altamirensis]|uniref:Aminoglycoside phosphotransferase domain-containing protein n=1 Tax=Hoyosella altamirensis TaxID=616997 RepID=A0A839RGD1_9ACTN|nr:phosphotransferase [Hoyosella altamirensis]MBB3035782.1 hypothetical protein [Hoyosella altamirensis]